MIMNYKLSSFERERERERELPRSAQYYIKEARAGISILSLNRLSKGGLRQSKKLDMLNDYAEVSLRG